MTTPEPTEDESNEISTPPIEGIEPGVEISGPQTARGTPFDPGEPKGQDQKPPTSGDGKASSNDVDISAPTAAEGSDVHLEGEQQAIKDNKDLLGL